MKILVLTRYNHSGASNQMHFYQYLSWLEASNIEAVILSLLSDAYVANLQRGPKSCCEMIAAYPQRLKSLLNVQSFDLVWIEKEALPWLPIFVERALLSKRIFYILDKDDSVFHYYDLRRNPAVKYLLSSKSPALMRSVSYGRQLVSGRICPAFKDQVCRTSSKIIDLVRYLALGQKSVMDKSTLPCIG